MLDKLLKLDKAYSNRLRVAEKPGRLRLTAAVLAHSGDSWFWFLALGLLWLFGSPTWKAFASVLLLSILGTALIVLALKFTIRRQRPVGEWGEIYRRTDPHSFPSGHAARAALLAVLGIGLGPGWLGVILLVWSILVTFARVAMGVHYLSDVLAGFALGLACGIVTLLLT